LIGKRISHYRIIEPIREGGMGAVYKAKDLDLERLVAIKVVKPSAHDRAATNHRFVREAQAIARIDHPNVVALHEILHEGDEYYLVMQLIPGASLREAMQGRRPSPAEALAITCQVGAGLKAAHELGVVHRDIKPENIMATPTGQYKILDFGVAHLADRSTLTDLSRIVGTLPYMAPEQLRGEGADARTDIYALGVLLYELLVGRPPFTAEEEAALFYEILNREPPDPATLRPDLPEGVGRVIAQALRKNRADRYASIDEMLHDLELIRARIAEPAFESGRGLLARPRPLPRRLLWAAVTGAVALSAFGVLVAKPGWWGAPRAPRIMVTRWEGADLSPDLGWLSSGVMDCLIRSLGNREGFRVISRQAVAASFAALRPEGAEGQRAAGLVAARRLGASYLVSGTLEPRGSATRLSCELTDVRTGLLAKSWSRDLSNLRAEFYPAIDALAADVAAALGNEGRQATREPRGTGQLLTTSMDALMHYHRALEEHELNDLPAALDELRQATAIDSTFTDAHLLLSSLTPEEPERAAHLLQAMKYRNRASVKTSRLVEAEDLLARHQSEGAIRKYQEVLAGDPDDVWTRSRLAEQLAGKRRFGEAAAEFAILRELDPYDYSFYPEWAHALVEIGRKDRAAALITSWHAEFPRERAPLRELIQLQRLLGNYRDGLTLCDSLDAIEPGSARALRGFLLTYLGRFDEAEALFRELLASPDKFTSTTRAYSWLALVMHRRQHYAQGLGLIEQAIARQPEAYNYWIAGLLAAGLRDSLGAGRYLGAIAAGFESPEEDTTAVEAFGSRRFYYHLEGVIALERSRPGEAVLMLERALRYTSVEDDPYFRTWLARALLEAGKPARAITELDRVLAFNPNYPEALLYLGRACARVGANTRARHVLEQLGTLWKEADRDDPLTIEWRRLLSQVTSPESGSRAQAVPHREARGRAERTCRSGGYAHG
jgi:tetratricopeptide (TPR) repeat protein/tRNA A-37 threonylcarbamoyl transferase component Bud32